MPRRSQNAKPKDKAGAASPKPTGKSQAKKRTPNPKSKTQTKPVPRSNMQEFTDIVERIKLKRLELEELIGVLNSMI